MSFNGIRKPYVKILERGRPYWFPRSVEIRNHRVSKVITEPMPLPLTLSIDGNSKADLLEKAEEMAEWLNTEDVAPLVFDDQPNRIYWSILDGEVDENEIVSFSRASTEFICLKKTGEERTITIDTTATETIGGHKPTAWKTKTTFDENQSGYELQFNSPGKSDLRDIGKIEINYNFQRGDVLEIDYSKRKITVNGVDRSNILVILQSNYMELPVGEVEFEASHDTEVFYSERYY